MSFTSTPLGNGRRLDQQTFLGKQPSGTTNARPAPASYALGAPTAGSRSPSAPNTKALRPEKWAVKDTSVNIATAFAQAADPMSHNASWASGSKQAPNVPRSTSVEFEQSQHTSQTRRLAPPPGRTLASRPPNSSSTTVRSKPSSVRYVPPVDEQPEQERGKSPGILEGLSGAVRKASSFYVRQRSVAPLEEEQSQSYSYANEEQEVQNQTASRGPAVRKLNSTHKRNRMSSDNKAYRPTRSDDESEDDYSEDDSRGGKKKKKKKESGGGPLTTLPVAGYDKKKKRRKSGNGKGGTQEEEEQQSEEEQQQQPPQPQRIIPQLQRAPSIPPPPPRAPSRAPSAPPEDRFLEESIDEVGLDSIPEAEETSGEISQDSIAVKVPPGPTGLGALLGKVARPFYSVTVAFSQFILRVIGFTGWVLGLIVHYLFGVPLRWFSQHNVLPAALFFGLLLGAYMLLEPLRQLLSTRGSVYVPPHAPPSTPEEYTDRLQRLEGLISGLVLDNQRTRAQQDVDAKLRAEIVGELEGVKNRGQDALKDGANAARRLDLVNNQVERLRAELETRASAPPPAPIAAPPGPAPNDEEARAQIRALEGRLGNVEGEVKEAVELSKSSAKALAAVGSGASHATQAGAAWWNKLASGARSDITIKTSDGTDVTSFISHLVDSALSQYAKDTLARRDFALYSGGGSVIPHLCSSTYEITHSSTVGAMLGVLTGSGQAIGRPPVTALHYDIQNGNCWPVAGTVGQLGVLLAAPVYISDVTIDHVAKENTDDLRSTPREMELWGLVEGADNNEKIRNWEASRAQDESLSSLPAIPSTLPKYVKYVRIAAFTYDIHAPENIQTFPADPEIRALGVDFGVTVLLWKNNWGRDDYTCLYRLRVYGDRKGAIPEPWSPQIEEHSS